MADRQTLLRSQPCLEVPDECGRTRAKFTIRHETITPHPISEIRSVKTAGIEAGRDFEKIVLAKLARRVLAGVLELQQLARLYSSTVTYNRCVLSECLMIDAENACAWFSHCVWIERERDAPRPGGDDLEQEAAKRNLATFVGAAGAGTGPGCTGVHLSQ